MAKQTIGVGSTANDGTGDNLRAGAQKVNANFNELYSALGDGTNVQITTVGAQNGLPLVWSSTNSRFAAAELSFARMLQNLDTNGYKIVSSSGRNITIETDGVGDILLNAGGNSNVYIDGVDGNLKYEGAYATESDLPLASNHHGMFAHVHATGRGYFAHGGNWYKLLDENSSLSELADVSNTSPSIGQVLKWSGSSWAPAAETGGGAGSGENFGIVASDAGTATSTTSKDTLTISGSTYINTSVVGKTVTIQYTGPIGSATLAGLTDVDETSYASPAAVGTMLYANGSGQWQGNAGPVIAWALGAAGTSSYTFQGPGFTGSIQDPVLYLYRGMTYKFVNGTGTAHPFQIRTSNGGTAYTAGVSGSSTGTTTFVVPMDAPATLYYQCTIHSAMGNTINIV